MRHGVQEIGLIKIHGASFGEEKLFTYSLLQTTRPLFKHMKIRYMFEYILFVRKNQVFSKENRVEILKNFTQNLKLRGKDQRKKYICDYIMRKWLSHNKR